MCRNIRWIQNFLEAWRSQWTRPSNDSSHDDNPDIEVNQNENSDDKEHEKSYEVAKLSRA